VIERVVTQVSTVPWEEYIGCWRAVRVVRVLRENDILFCFLKNLDLERPSEHEYFHVKIILPLDRLSVHDFQMELEVELSIRVVSLLELHTPEVSKVIQRLRGCRWGQLEASRILNDAP
jgi:hypothetical protein